MNLHGESVLGHGLILAAAFLLLVIATILAASVVWIPAAVVVGIVGLFALAGGIWAHITNPVNVEDLADSLVKMTGAAIAITFGIAVIATVAGYAVSVVVGLLRWLAA
jgi:hypothetical protein